MKSLIFFLSFLFPNLSIYASTIKTDLLEMSSEGHQPLSYQEVKIEIFRTIDLIDGQVCSVYTEGQCKRPGEKKKHRNQKGRGFKLNIEHTWPQSKGADELPANSDLYHLFITSKESNSKRANHPFCEVGAVFWEYGGSFLGIDDYGQDCFEPRDVHKGNVARAMFYFSIRYQLPIDQDQEAVLRRWNREDPVDDSELSRMERIIELQGNMNPFILDSELVDQIQDF